MVRQHPLTGFIAFKLFYIKYMSYQVEKVCNTNQVSITNTFNSAKTVFNFQNHVHVNSLFDMLEQCVLLDKYDNVYTILTLLKERLKPELIEDFATLFNALNIEDHGTN